jgi:two-component system nitrate/nitrite sensor histidine kinase NarX
MTQFLSDWRRLSTKIVGALVGFLLIALFAIGSTLLLSWQLEGSSAAINEAGSLRMHSYRLTMLLARVINEPDRDETRPAAALESQVIDVTFARLQRGDPQRPLYLPPTATIRAEFQHVMERWARDIRPLAGAILQLEGAARQAAWQRHESQIDSFVADIDKVVHLIEKDSEQRTFWLRSSQLMLVAMAIAGTVAMVYMMFLLIIQPVTRLQEGMERMAEKDFNVRLPVESKDEFGQLTEGFNQMADRLQGLYGSLEQRVKSKTAELEAQNRELALLYDSAAFLQLPQPVEAICEGFLHRISQYFGADGGSVRVLESGKDKLHMVSHHGISADLAEAAQCLKVGECLCGEAVEKKVAVVHDLHRIDQARDLQCRREGFVTVSIFHIHAHQQHLGFFNLHFRQPKIFSKGEEALLETLGQLLGVAIENVRLGTREREMAVSEERNLVAQGLHDSIAQGLTFLNIQVQMLEDSVSGGRMGEVADIVPALRAGVQESYEDVRELLLNFRSRLSEGDLVRSFETTIEKFRQQTGIEASFTCSGIGSPFPREQQLQILFIVQEALSNIRKHSMAHRLDIRLDDQQDFALTIRDNGIGFDAETVLRKGQSHVGINIMRERAERIHAQFEVTSAPGQGTIVSLRVPRSQRRAA